MKALMRRFPQIKSDELAYVEQVANNFDEEDMDLFEKRYKAQRCNPKLLLGMNLIAFLGIAGVHRFMIGENVMGFLYLFTWGFLGIGIIYDIVHHKRMALEYNEKVAFEVAHDVKYLTGEV